MRNLLFLYMQETKAGISCANAQAGLGLCFSHIQLIGFLMKCKYELMCSSCVISMVLVQSVLLFLTELLFKFRDFLKEKSIQ